MHFFIDGNSPSSMRTRIRKKPVRTPVTGVNAYSPSPLRRYRQQVRDIRSGQRGLVAHWFRMKFVPSGTIFYDQRLNEQSNPPSLSSRRAKLQFLGLHSHLSARGVNLTNGTIVRAGFVPRVSREMGKKSSDVSTVSIPYIPGKFFSYMETTMDGKRKKGSLAQKSFRDPRNRKSYSRAHDQGTFNIGLNCILEVGKNAHGEPTHILVMKRPSSVPIEPNVFDFPAGIIRNNREPQSLVKDLNDRIFKETGLPTNEFGTIGPQFRNTKDPIFFALQRVNRLANYNPVIIQRFDRNVSDVRNDLERHLRQKEGRDAHAGSTFMLIPRTPDAIREFARTHPTFMPEIFRLYARELYRNGVR